MDDSTEQKSVFCLHITWDKDNKLFSVLLEPTLHANVFLSYCYPLFLISNCLTVITVEAWQCDFRGKYYAATLKIFRIILLTVLQNRVSANEEREHFVPNVVISQCFS